MQDPIATSSDDDQPLASSATQNSRLTRVGARVSVLYLVFLAVMAVAARGQLFALSPNEFGDMLAGAFAPLAFLWLVLGFFQQGEELKASVAALQLQGDELRNSAEQQRELVNVTREQLERESEAFREHAAQPALVPYIGGSFSGEEASYEIGFRNTGPDAKDVRILVEGIVRARNLVLAKGARLEFKQRYQSHEDITDIAGFVNYVDAQGNSRARQFVFPLIPEPGPNGRNLLGEGRILETLFKPPFLWETEKAEIAD